MPAIARILITIKRFCVEVPVRTPSALTAVKTAIATIAITAVDPSWPVNGEKYAANVTAAAAIPPLCDTKRSVHPKIKASAG